MRLRFIALFLCLGCSLPLSASPISHAMVNNWATKKFRKAIRSEKDVRVLSDHKESYLHIAVRLNRPEHLNTLIRERPEILERLLWRDAFAQTAFELAITLDRLDVFKILLRHLRDKDFRIWNRYHWTLMHLAARYNRAEFIRALTEAGAEINPLDLNGEQWTPLDVALHFGQNDATTTLRELGGEIHALELANDEPAPEPIFLEDDELFNRYQMPLSDFEYGPLAIRLSLATFIICFWLNFYVPSGGPSLH